MLNPEKTAKHMIKFMNSSNSKNEDWKFRLIILGIVGFWAFAMFSIFYLDHVLTKAILNQ